MIDKKLNTIIRRAFQVAKIKSGDVDLTENELNDARYSLNTMLKSWDNRGFHIWKRKVANLILNKSQNQYTIPEDMCFNEIYPTEIKMVEQTSQYFIPTNVENLSVGMDIYFPEFLGEKTDKIKEILENKVRLEKGLFRILNKNTVFFAGINLLHGEIENDYTTETTQIELPVIANINDTIFFKTTEDWIERKIISVQNNIYVLDQSIENIPEGSMFIVAPILYKKEVSEALSIQYRTITVENKKGFAEGQDVIYFDKDGIKHQNKIIVIDGDKIVLENELSQSVVNTFSDKVVIDEKEPFEQEEILSDLALTKPIVYVDDNICFKDGTVSYSMNRGTSWIPLLDSDNDPVQAWVINYLDGKYYFFHEDKAWYLDEGSLVAEKLDLLGCSTSPTTGFNNKNLINKFDNKYYIVDVSTPGTILVSDDGVNFQTLTVGTTEDFWNAFMFDNFVVASNINSSFVLDLRTNTFIYNDNIEVYNTDNLYMIRRGDEIVLNNVILNLKDLTFREDLLTSYFSYNWFRPLENNAYLGASQQGFFYTSIPGVYNYIVGQEELNQISNYYSYEDKNYFYIVFDNDRLVKYYQPKKATLDKCVIVALDKQIQKPDEISSIRLYSFLDDREEYPCIISRNEFDKLPREGEGEPTQLYYDKQLEDGVVNIWNTPKEDCLYIEIDYVESIDPLDTSREMPDFTDQFVEAVIYNLAYKLAIEYGVPVDDLTALKNEADTMLEMADLHDNEDCSIFLQPGR